MQNTKTPLAHGIIPARYASSRFPGKPLALIHGKPMFWHVWQRACLCPALASVHLATDDERIAKTAKELGVPCIMTATSHQSGTDRVHEAACILNLPQQSIIVNLQGDEPTLNPAAINQLLSAFNDKNVLVGTLAHEISKAQATQEDKVKVVCASNGDALYFSRSIIPYQKEMGHLPILGHIGLYAFKRSVLDFFVSIPPSLLEKTEKLEQLRLLENGIPIRVVRTAHTAHGVDTKSDLDVVLAMLGNGEEEIHCKK